MNLISENYKLHNLDNEWLDASKEDISDKRRRQEIVETLEKLWKWKKVEEWNNKWWSDLKNN